MSEWPAPASIRHLTRPELEAGLDRIRAAPADAGVLELIVRRPRVNEREVLETGELDRHAGLVGDRWSRGRSREAVDARRDTQVNVMGARVIELVAQDRARWALAGDQLFIDLDLSTGNLPPGSQIEIGSAIIEVTDEPHTGCRKFVARFGVDAMKFVNSPVGRALRLRGLNARVVQPGTIRRGDIARKRMPSPA
jgi:hypothetical protein